MIPNIAKAVLSLSNGSDFILRGDTYSGLEWLDTQKAKPTEAEVNIELARLQVEYTAQEYQRLRQAEYPSIADQLDTLYHSGLDAWKAQIKTVKDKFPKA
jgi:predicted lipoprotein